MAIRETVMNWRDWPEQLRALWRRSMQLRVVTSTLALAGTAVLIIGLVMSYTVAANLFQTQLNQVLTLSAQATSTADSILQSSDASDATGVQAVMNSTLRSITATATTDLVAIYRVPGQEYSPVAPQDRVASGLADAITAELRAKVQASPNQQFWQSVRLRTSGGQWVPGVVVGSQIMLPSTAGGYELYLGYRLTETQNALTSMQFIGIAGALMLLVMLGIIIWFTVRWIVGPVRTAAETSQRLARGDLDVRLPAHGSDEIATLAQSFNGMANSLQAQISELAELSTMQQRFVSDVSHELRTPLTTIRLASEMLYSERGIADPAVSRTIELLHDQTIRFEELLADLLEISRYDAGSVTLDVEPTNLVHLAESVAQSFATLAEGRGSSITVNAPGGHFDAEVDPRRVRRVVRNLVGNAIEHGEGRPIVITVDSNGSSVAIGVRDFGLGMDSDEQLRAFDRFWRADPARARTIGGTGLGLAISLEDAHAHGGILEVWSVPGEGSHFVLTLPRTVGSPRLGKPVPVNPTEQDGADDA
ncbi:MAG: MtrAB system histidine kinase MtrB [Agromyces sp.]